MTPSNSESSSEGFFNNLSYRANEIDPKARSDTSNPTNIQNTTNKDSEEFVPRTKRIACIVCRKRKLKCDGTKPRCGTCARLGHNCAYDEARKKSGPKRGYVKHLEARLAQVETLLKTHDSSDPPETSNDMPNIAPVNFSDVPAAMLPGEPQEGMPQLIRGTEVTDPYMDSMMDNLGLGADETFSWELLSLGLEEPLPSQDLINDMHQIYFENIHPSVPIIHRPRYLAAMDFAPNMRPPVCLRYAMWTHVCAVTPRYSALTDLFYARARKYAELDEMRGFGESMVTVGHCQCWSLIANHEFKMMYFPRAWMSVGRASRLAQMMSLHRQDGVALDVKQALPPPRDWTEREERRRTFWIAFSQDRYASIGTGWPMTIDERDISTNLPATEEAFLKSKPEATLPLAGVMTADGASTLSPFGGIVLMACLFGRNLTHLHGTAGEDDGHDLNGAFWTRHRSLDNILLNTSLSLPPHLRVPAGINDPNIVFVNMNIHASTICLHQAAIFKADKNHMSPHVSGESKRRCIIAADQIANIMKLISHIDLSTMNPFIAFCLYVAARVFVQYLKSHRDDASVMSSLEFLLSALQALKPKNPLSGSFLVQLDVDLEASGLRSPSRSTGPYHTPCLTVSGKPPVYDSFDSDQSNCISIFEVRDAQEREQATANAERPVLSKTTSEKSNGVSEFPPMERQSFMPGFPDQSKDSASPPTADPMFGQLSSMYNNTSYNMDMDVSLDTATSQRFLSQPNSGFPTPCTSSNNPSSQSSFSPPHPDEHANRTSTSNSAIVSPNTASTAAIANKHQAFLSSHTDRLNAAEVPDAAEALHSFAMPAAWDHANNRPSPENIGGGFELPSMTPAELPPWQPMRGNDWLF